MDDLLLSAVGDDQGRQFAALDAPGVEAFGVCFQGEGVVRVVSVDDSRQHGLGVFNGLFHTGIQERLVFVVKLEAVVSILWPME